LSPSYSSSFYSEEIKNKSRYRSISSSSSAKYTSKRKIKKEKRRESRKRFQEKSIESRHEDEKVNLEISLEKGMEQINYDSDATQVNLKVDASSIKENFENVTGEVKPVNTEVELKDDEVMAKLEKYTGEEEVKYNGPTEGEMSQGLILRSKFLAESSSNDNYGAIEVYSNFKKLNISDFPNIHRKL
jgi:hypothetical protein